MQPFTAEFKNKYIGKEIELYPGDTYCKRAVILDVDMCGWTLQFIEGTHPASGYVVGEVAFFNHATHINFKFINH